MAIELGKERNAKQLKMYSKLINSNLRIGTATFAYNLPRVRKDGKIIWVHANATLLRDPDGRPERTMAVIGLNHPPVVRRVEPTPSQLAQLDLSAAHVLKSMLF